jgi:hypothetical protein
MRSLRAFFFVCLALAYGLLGAGPSLWALGLAPERPVEGAACGMHVCKMKHKKGEVCLCLIRTELLKSAEGECQVRAQGCGDEGHEDGASLAPLRPHLKPQAILTLPAHFFVPAPAPAFVFVSDFVRPTWVRPPIV